MDENAALEIAGYLVSELISPTQDRQRFDRETDAVARSLQATVPDVGDVWAIVKLSKLMDTEAEGDPSFLALTEGTLFWVRYDPPDGEVPSKLIVTRLPEDKWRLGNVGDAQFTDPAGGPHVLRQYGLELGGNWHTFSSEELVVSEPQPSREERLGRVLALVGGWEIGPLLPS